MRLRRSVLVIPGIALAFAGVLAGLWMVRAWTLGRFAEYYFRQHGVHAAVEVQHFGLWSATARFALGSETAPDMAADRIELIFDPLRWAPYLTEVRLIKPVVRADIGADGKVTLRSLQRLIDSLAQQSGPSRYVSDDLAVSLTGLRAFLNTPAGMLVIDGDLKLRHNRPVSAHLQAQSGMISWQGIRVAMRSARLVYDGANLSLAFSGDVSAQTVSAQELEAVADVRDLRWSNRGMSAASARLDAGAAALNMGAQFDRPRIAIVAQNPNVTGAGARADLHFTAGADPKFDFAMVGDRLMRSALARGLAHLQLDGSVHLERNGDTLSVRATQPWILNGANGLALRLPALSVSQSPRGLDAAFAARLQGGGMPAVTVATNDLAWREGQLAGNVTLDARFSYLMLHGAALSAKGALSWQDGRYAFTPASCMRLSLAALHPSQSDLAKDIRTTFCAGDKPLLSGQDTQWRLSGIVRNASAFLPVADAQLDGAEARLDFTGHGGAFQGNMAIAAARISDHAPQTRFHPLQGSGSLAVADSKWRGQLTATQDGKTALGTVSFRHDMKSGAGAAHIDAPHLVFAEKGLQPENLSPLLAQFRRADGTAHFQGDVGWNGGAITSSGTLSVDNLDFLSPLGRAHGLKTTLALTSLVPFKTAENQQVTIARIDWTLPFSGIALRFSADTQTAQIASLTANWADGHIAMAPFTIHLATPSNISGTATLSSITLDSLITASNLGNRVKLSGKISGTIPFAATAQDIRITKGRIASDSPGRLSVDRSLWVQGDAAVASNAVQDFAYQAMENLAFDQMTADLNSVAGGRLQIVFHIKGRSDPPKPQTADVAISDILNGTALQKPIPLPSGTPIDLTLDTSLNFDELLKSYAEAWSMSLGPAGHPDTGAGAKP